MLTFKDLLLLLFDFEDFDVSGDDDDAASNESCDDTSDNSKLGHGELLSTSGDEFLLMLFFVEYDSNNSLTSCAKAAAFQHKGCPG